MHVCGVLKARMLKWFAIPFSSGPQFVTSGQIDGGKMEIVTDFIFLGSKSLQTVITTMKLKDACSLERKAMTKLDNVFFLIFLIKSKDITLPTKVCIVKAIIFSSSHVQM